MNKILFYISENIELVLIKDGLLRFEEHSHSSHMVISAVLDGCAQLAVNGEKRDIKAGMVFFILPYENHSLYSEKPVDMVSLCIKQQLFQVGREEYYRLVRTAVKGLWEREELSRSDICQSITDTAMAVYDTETDTPQEDELLVRDRDDIEDFPENDEDIENLANDSYMSKFHYIRKFREIAGLTPNRFRIQSRIRKAQQLLKNGGSITGTALDVGFYDQSHFNKYFKRIVGVSPKEYISSLRNFLQ